MLVFSIGLLACSPGLDPRPQSARYDHWLSQGGQVSMQRYRDYLARHGVADVLPMPQLLTSARRWRLCRASEFAVPPSSSWPSMVQTLQLVRDLQHARLLPAATVASGYRDERLNACEGGSSRSRHIVNSALDFDLSTDPALTQRLCTFWRRHGARHRFGLGFYRPGQIHVDTAGFRTWGTTFRRDSSLCLTGQSAGTNASRAHTPK